jgi:hypothetical protein
LARWYLDTTGVARHGDLVGVRRPPVVATARQIVSWRPVAEKRMRNGRSTASLPDLTKNTVSRGPGRSSSMRSAYV